MASHGYTGFGVIVGAIGGLLFLPVAIAILAGIAQVIANILVAVVAAGLMVALVVGCIFILSWIFESR